MTLNSTILKKLEKKRKELGKSSIDFIAGRIKRSAVRYSEFAELADQFRPKLDEARTGQWRAALQLLTRLQCLLPLSKELEYRAFHQGNLEHAKLLFHRRMTHWYLLRHLENTQFGDKRLNQNHTGNVAETILGLYAIGWHREAEEYCRNIWLNFDGGFGRGGGGPRASELVFWFANYFALGSRDLIEPWLDHPNLKGEPDQPQHGYSLLLGCWKDLDPDKAANTLTAFSEHNAAQVCLPDGALFATEYNHLLDWRFIPYDVAAIQMRRKALGLPWIDNGDERLEMCFAFGDEAPLVKDDIIWPTYLEACELFGITPYQPRKSVEVRVNRDDYDCELLE